MLLKKSIIVEYCGQSTYVLPYIKVARCHQDFCLLSYGKLGSHGAVWGDLGK